MRPNPFGSGQ